MPISQICNREVIVARHDKNVLEAAKLMRQYHVGTVVVVEEQDGRQVPRGIVTDRDLVVEILAAEVDPKRIQIGDIVTEELISVRENCGIFKAIEYMRHKGVRRLPVVDDAGVLIGLVTLDDLLALLAEELSALAKLVEHEQKIEASRRY
jgi:signal-transduction protein with cAMP-binding, CBS, and nucleotidyltransferase domain